MPRLACQVGNAKETFVDLTGDPAAAVTLASRYAALRPGTDPVPLIWEVTDYGYCEDICLCGCWPG